MSYCPNCDATLEAKSGACWRCGADLGPLSAWRPIERPSSKTSTRRPSLVHGLAAVPIVAFTGPMILAVVLGLHPFVLIGALAAAVRYGLAAGLFFAAAAVILCLVDRHRVVRARLGAAIGAGAGAAVALLAVLSSSSGLGGAWPLGALYVSSGLIGGAVASHYFPIGVRGGGPAGTTPRPTH